MIQIKNVSLSNFRAKSSLDISLGITSITRLMDENNQTHDLKNKVAKEQLPKDFED